MPQAAQSSFYRRAESEIRLAFLAVNRFGMGDSMKVDYSDRHTFVICAYKESPYLEECINSLKEQSVKSTIIMVTSTPCSYISDIAQKYGIELYVNTGEKGISADWNFGISMANTQYVTVAHQDDTYRRNYTVECMHAMEHDRNPLIFFSNYGELRNGHVCEKNKLLSVKRLMLWPLGIGGRDRKLFSHSIFVRRRILSMGNPICCPSVTFNMKRMPEQIFKIGMKSNVDWEAWEALSRLKGGFLYNKNMLCFHRIHEASTTSELIADNGRTAEDYQMFCKFWPKWIARILIHWYTDSQKSNSLSA